MSRRALPAWPPARDARGRLISCLPPEEPPAEPLRPVSILLISAALATWLWLMLLILGSL